jgi:hypothetical protein
LFRNNQPYGDGTGGCRWTDTVTLQADRGTGNGYQDIWWNDWCYTCGGSYVQDSGRHWTDPSPLYDYFSQARGKSEGGQVRFYLADGTTRLVNESPRWGQSIFVP